MKRASLSIHERAQRGNGLPGPRRLPIAPVVQAVVRPARMWGLGAAAKPGGGGGEVVLLRGRRPPFLVGAVVTVLLVAVCTGLVYPLKQLTTVSSLGVVYLLGVIVVSTFWGLWMGVAMSVLSAAAFNFFHLPPVGRFTIADSRNWVALATFVVTAIASSTVSQVARLRAVEAERRRAEADLTAEMAQLLLGGGVNEGLALMGKRLASVFELPWTSLSLEEVAADPRRETIPLVSDGRTLGTLMIPAGQPAGVVARLRERVVPAIAAVLAVAVERERLVAEAVQTEGLRRSEAIKTAVLRAVSHDLRSPVTAMVAAGAAVRAPDVTLAERDELGTLVVQQGARLSRLIDDLLDLSKLEAGATNTRPDECSVEELIDAALASQPAEAPFEVQIDPDAHSVQADFGQVERVLANLLENARRFSGGKPVVIRARKIGGWITVRVVDRGPGIAPADTERIFEPFYRSAGGGGDTHGGSGLGLAIAKGFIEANGGRIWVESTVGHGTTFAVSLPVISSERADDE
jgi:two-component system, OmpR family, sensor histidine kinase KdpD